MQGSVKKPEGMPQEIRRPADYRTRPPKERAMNVNGIAGLATSMAAERSGQAVGIAVLKKALDVQSSGALALLNAIPAVPSVNLPAHLGQNVDTTA
jgi:hypothetical protein